MYSDNLVETLNALAHRKQPDIYHAIVEVLSQSKFKNSGAGVESVIVKVIDGTPSKAPEIIVDFEDYLNLLNLRKVEFTKQPPFDDFDRWSQTKSFSGPVPGYKNGLAPNLPPWKVKQRQVWAIIKSKQKFDTWKSKPWRKKSLSTVLKEMNEEVLREFDKAIEKDFQQAVTI